MAQLSIIIFQNRDMLVKSILASVMKQLDVVVSPPAFLWDPYLTFDLDICGL